MISLIILLIINPFYSLNQAFSSSLVSNPLHKTTDDNNNIIFSAPLIHRSSPKSPFFDPNYTREAHVEDGVHTSLARARYFSQIKASSTMENYALAPLSGWNLLMKYFIGTPLVESYGIFDTGSSFTWLQCRPCIKCYDQGYPLFDSRSSSSYQKVICFDRMCKMAPKNTCGGSMAMDPNLCLYTSNYLDGSYSRGTVSTETMALSSEDQTTLRTATSVVFGCGNDNQEAGGSPGIVGLGNLSTSFHHQFSVSHFSYYVFANETEIQGVVHFGPGASLSEFGMTTPLLPDVNGAYYLNLTGMSVDGSDLEFPSDIFEKDYDEDGSALGFVIDSGTTYSMLRSEAFDVFKSAIMDAMYEETPESSEHFELCYKDVRGAPEVVFQFSGLDYILCDANLWVRHNGLYCLAILRLKESLGKLSILGFHQQRNVQVGFDLEKDLLSLVYPGACPDDAVDFVQS